MLATRVMTMQRSASLSAHAGTTAIAMLRAARSAPPSNSAASALLSKLARQQPLMPSKIAFPVNAGASSARTLMTSTASRTGRATHMLSAGMARRSVGIVSLPTSTSAVPSAMLFSSMRLANAFQPHASALVRRSGTCFAPARHHAASYRKQFMHSNRYGRRRKQISGDAVVLGLVSANVLVTMMWLTAHSQRKKRRMMNHFTTSTLHLARGQYHTLLTSMFSHADVGHLLANMIGLFFFGRQMCDVLGPKRFLGLYLTSGVLSSWAAVYEQQYANRVSFNLGASGAVNSITAMSILLFPHSTLLIFGIIPLPAWVAGSMFIFKDAYSWATDRRDGIGHFAHLSGAFCGGAYYYYLRRAGMFRHF